MARKRQSDSHHHIVCVTGSGVTRRPVFERDVAKRDFVGRLRHALMLADAACIGWSLTRRDYALILVVEDIAIEDLMNPLLDGFSASYNRRCRRAGYVFRHDYRMHECRGSAAVLESLRAVHHLRLRTGTVDSLPALAAYAWSGHGALLGHRRECWQDTDHVLALFSPFAVLGREKYRAFMAGTAACSNVKLPDSPDAAKAMLACTHVRSGAW